MCYYCCYEQRLWLLFDREGEFDGGGDHHHRADAAAAAAFDDVNDSCSIPCMEVHKNKNETIQISKQLL